MMSLGLASPDLLVDIGRLPLAGTERVNGGLALGALTRHRELERSDELAGQVPLAAEAARHIGNPGSATAARSAAASATPTRPPSSGPSRSPTAARS